MMHNPVMLILSDKLQHEWNRTTFRMAPKLRQHLR